MMILEHDQSAQLNQPGESEQAVPRVYLFGTLPEGWELEPEECDGTGD